jgi:hypothetical protein
MLNQPISVYLPPPIAPARAGNGCCRSTAMARRSGLFSPWPAPLSMGLHFVRNITPFEVVAAPHPSQSDARWQSRSSRAKISVSGIFSTSARRLITSALSVVPRLRLNVATPRESPVTTVCRSLATALSKVLHERHPTKSPMQLDWTCRTSIVRQQLVRAKLIWESSTSYSTCPRMLFAILSGLSSKFCCTSINANWTAFLRTLAGANSKFCFSITMSRATDSARRTWRGRTLRSFDSSS